MTDHKLEPNIDTAAQGPSEDATLFDTITIAKDNGRYFVTLVRDVSVVGEEEFGRADLLLWLHHLLFPEAATIPEEEED